jgi:hypothetical protein
MEVRSAVSPKLGPDGKPVTLVDLNKPVTLVDLKKRR